MNPITPLAILSLALGNAPAAESFWSASSGLPPSRNWPAWDPFLSGTPMPTATMEDGNLHLDSATAPAQLAFFQQQGSMLAFPDKTVIEARLELHSATAGNSLLCPCVIQFALGDGSGNSLCIRPNQIYLGTTSNIAGPAATVDTSSAHTYRIEINGSTKDSVIQVFVDDIPTLTGTAYLDPSWHGNTKVISFGDRTAQGFADSRWHSFRHNALSPVPVLGGRILIGYIGRQIVAINTTTGAASFLATDPTLPASPIDFVLQLTPQPSTGMLFGIIDPDVNPRLLKLNPATLQSSIVGPIQTAENTIKGAEAISFDPSNGHLYASVHTIAGSPWSPIIAKVSPDTGASTLIGTISDTWEDDVDVMTIANGKLYAMDTVVSKQSSYLYTVDTTTWQTHLVGATGKINHSLAFEPGAGVFYSSEYPSNRLLIISPENASATIVGTTHNSTEFATRLYALAFTPPSLWTRLQISRQPGGFLLDWPSLQGLVYQIQDSNDLSSWSPYGDPRPGTGGSLSLPANDQPGARFFRLHILSP